MQNPHHITIVTIPRIICLFVEQFSGVSFSCIGKDKNKVISVFNSMQRDRRILFCLYIYYSFKSIAKSIFFFRQLKNVKTADVNKRYISTCDITLYIESCV